MKGFITLHRDILDHWIADNPEHFYAWVCILTAANWGRREVAIGCKVTICERGQCIRSLQQWAEIFGKNWDKYRVRRFFLTLQEAHMIRLDKAIKAQRLTVVNYDTYQDQRTDDATRMHPKCNDGATMAQRDNNNNQESNLQESGRGRDASAQSTQLGQKRHKAPLPLPLDSGHYPLPAFACNVAYKADELPKVEHILANFTKSYLQERIATLKKRRKANGDSGRIWLSHLLEAIERRPPPQDKKHAVG